jgi:hypothetical protein
MSEEKIESKINEWKKPILTQIGSYQIRDIHAERLNPLQLDMRQLHEVYVESQKRGEAKNEPKRD